MTIDNIFDSMENDIKPKFPNFDFFELKCLDTDEIEKGKYKPIICYAVTEEESILVNTFLVVCTDKKTESEFIYVEYNQVFGKEGIYRYI